MATRTIKLFGISWEVEYSATKFHPATFDEPAYGGVEIEAIRVEGNDMTDHLGEATGNAIQAYVKDNLAEWEAEEAAMAAEDKAERQAEERSLALAA